jgi:hypothetical protein
MIGKAVMTQHNPVKAIMPFELEEQLHPKASAIEPLDSIQIITWPRNADFHRLHIYAPGVGRTISEVLTALTVKGTNLCWCERVGDKPPLSDMVQTG